MEKINEVSGGVSPPPKIYKHILISLAFKTTKSIYNSLAKHPFEQNDTYATE